MEIMALGGLSQKDAQKAITNTLIRFRIYAMAGDYPWEELKVDALKEGKRMIEERARKKQKLMTENLQDTD